MKESMLQKIKLEQVNFTDIETEWLMNNIGNEDPLIRDEIVFILLANGIIEGGFTKNQFEYIKNRSIDENLMFYQIEKGLPSTLTRSFSTLLNGFIIQADGLRTSIYYHSLNNLERNYFFNAAENYLFEEKDMTSFSTEYGWVHSFGHFGDYIFKVINHDLYNINNFPQILNGIYFLFKNLEKSFEFCEERRLAHGIYEGLKTQKVPQDMLTNWINDANFVIKDNRDYYGIAAFENFLSYIYFHSMNEVILSEPLKKAMLSYLKEYTLY